MVPQWLIEKKRDGGALTAEEIRFLVRAYTDGTLPDYQMAAFAMAVFFRGMTQPEILEMTRAMIETGGTLQTQAIALPKVDKHSTGGIGDKISLVLAPVAAACGLAVPMVSGRGLGITGGTLDKLESIPGYRTALREQDFIEIVAACGCGIMGQTDTLAPADRKLYALRDVTGTVPSIPLISASIMSKKLAEGLDGLVLDVKCGRGAFMKDPDSARQLAQTMTEVGRRMGKPMAALITDMDQPLGRTAGNALEVREAIDVLRNQGPPDIRELTVALCAQMQTLAEPALAPDAAQARAADALESGAALERFRKMIALHGADADVLDDRARLPSAPVQRAVPAPKDGVVHQLDAQKIGQACLLLGAGRKKTTDSVDHAVGVAEMKKVGEPVAAGEPLAVVHANSDAACDEACPAVLDAYTIGRAPVTTAPLVREIIC